MTNHSQDYFLRPIKTFDHSVLRDVYCDAITSQGASFYNSDQIEAWSSLAFLPGILDRSLNNGKGWVVVSNETIEAFAIRHPSNHLDLLYCRGRSSRKGYATKLLKKIELDARHDCIETLFTEASLLSYPLLLRSGWRFQSSEKIKIAGVGFLRYLMYKRFEFFS